MNKKDFKILQHNLIPLALFTGNIALGHFIYLVAGHYYSYPLILTFITLLTLTLSILRPNKYLLLTAIIFYTLFLSFSLIGT